MSNESGGLDRRSILLSGVSLFALSAMGAPSAAQPAPQPAPPAPSGSKPNILVI